MMPRLRPRLLPAAILALVNILKGLGLPARLSPIAAIVIGSVLNVSIWAFADYGWFSAAAQGLMLALAASGVYDVSRTVSTTLNVEADRAEVITSATVEPIPVPAEDD